MREMLPSQLQLGEIDIASIQFNPRSRDDIPQLLKGLQFLYADKVVRDKIFSVLELLSPADVSTKTGRPGTH